MQEVLEKIIKRLKEETDCPNCSMYCADADMCGFDEMRKQAIEIVNQVASEYGGGWIPVSERLPEENVLEDGTIEPSEEVLVYIYFNENHVDNGYRVSRYKSHPKHYDSPWIDIILGKDNVIAWKPIEPYKAESEG